MSLKFALLGLLAESPKYGYEIKRRSKGRWATSGRCPTDSCIPRCGGFPSWAG